eukprot:5329465-Prymnesium_polylepis.1
MVVVETVVEEWVEVGAWGAVVRIAAVRGLAGKGGGGDGGGEGGGEGFATNIAAGVLLGVGAWAVCASAPLAGLSGREVG